MPDTPLAPVLLFDNELWAMGLVALYTVVILVLLAKKAFSSSSSWRQKPSINTSTTPYTSPKRFSTSSITTLGDTSYAYEKTHKRSISLTHSISSMDTVVERDQSREPTDLHIFDRFNVGLKQVLFNYLPRPFDGYTCLRFLVILGFIGVVLAFCSIDAGPPTSSSDHQKANRYAHIGLALLPLVTFLPMRASAIAGIHINWLHRIAAFVLFGVSAVHAGLIHAYGQAPLYDLLTGWLAVSPLFLVILASTVRTRFFQTFWLVHAVGALAFVGLLCFHAPKTIPYAVASAILYAIDLLIRFGFKTRITVAKIRALPGDITELLVQTPHPLHVRSGAYAYLRVPQQWWESHPFTITTTSVSSSLSVEDNPTASTIRILVRARGKGRWTQKLQQLARRMTLEDLPLDLYLDGPYGGYNGSRNPSTTVLIAGGIGITFAISAVEALLRKERTGNIHLIWVIRSPESLAWFERELNILSWQAHRQGVSFRQDIYCTRVKKETTEVATTETTPETQSMLSNQERSLTPPPRAEIRPQSTHKTSDSITVTESTQFLPLSRLEAGAYYHHGRPDLKQLFSEIISSGSFPTGTTGIDFAACGPTPLLKSIRSAVASLDPWKVAKVGGFSLHTEEFGH